MPQTCENVGDQVRTQKVLMRSESPEDSNLDFLETGLINQLE